MEIHGSRYLRGLPPSLPSVNKLIWDSTAIDWLKNVDDGIYAIGWLKSVGD